MDSSLKDAKVPNPNFDNFDHKGRTCTQILDSVLHPLPYACTVTGSELIWERMSLFLSLGRGELRSP
jgi:hypothetical protein